ncbi:hypothetical protein QBC46DRAFT_253357 [Diplogelasinospora grovesii]|uniref:Uncharacterized protein n=1 Tax=Diplogelasinospora grovesii TaxID=303347 RepID=A0AAN6NDK2_9PEZI|nr:hypothetical protein QBC46DRAFT_253357 [Diplogelasinospora grovesii]
MSIFSMMKRGREAAKQHKAQKAELQKKEEQKAPYKHIPKHAAVDALSGGPATWRDSDRPRILEENKRRSAMTASGVGMGGMTTPGNMTPVHMGMTRVNSALSHVSYPNAYASPVVQLPRAYSFHSGWSHNAGEVTYNPIDISSSTSVKGKEVERVMVDSGRASRTSSKMSVTQFPLDASVPATTRKRDSSNSPVSSSGNSTSSQDDLEMKLVKHVKHAGNSSPPRTAAGPASGATTPTSRPLSEPDYFHRLHPGSHARKNSDPNRGQAVAPVSTSMSGGIPPVPALPPMQFGGIAFSGPTTSSAASSAASSSSSVTVVPVASSTSIATKTVHAVPVPVPIPVVEDVVPEATESLEDDGAVGTAITTPQTSTAAYYQSEARRVSKMARFQELETINSHVSMSVETQTATTPTASHPAQETWEKTRPASTVTALPTTFDESYLQTQEPMLPPPRSGKLSKSAAGGAKLVKKNRWSLRSSKTAAVAG